MSDWIVNASPLILLGKINQLSLLEELAPSFLIPNAVALEILAGPSQDPAKIWIRNHHITQRIVSEIPIPPPILAWDLGAGETAVIALALHRSSGICVIDDLAARNCAETFSLPLLGTLGVLLKAKTAGLIPELKPEIDHLLRVGSLLSASIIQLAMKLAGERP